MTTLKTTPEQREAVNRLASLPQWSVTLSTTLLSAILDDLDTLIESHKKALWLIEAVKDTHAKDCRCRYCAFAKAHQSQEENAHATQK